MKKLSGKIREGAWRCVPHRTPMTAASLLLLCGITQAQIVTGDKPEDLAARAVMRAALLDLKLVREPGESDYRVTAAVLESAHALSGEGEVGEQVLRMLIEAQTGAGNAERVQELTRKLVQIDPDDTVAQLRLITGRVSRLQTIDARLAAYERFLGPDGESLDPSVRSRLALDAALLERERGNLSKFAERLAFALEQDSTNKDAATLALTFFADRVDDPLGRLDLLLGVLYADPMDVQAHRAISRELASTGAYVGAERFVRTLNRLYMTLGMTPDAEEMTFREVVSWNLHGAEAIVRQLSDDLDDARKDVLRKRNTPSGRTLGIDESVSAEDVRLPFTSERTRLLAASAADNAEAAARSMADLAETARRAAEQIADPARRPPGMTEQQVTPQVQAILAEIVWLRLWTNQQLAEAESGLAVLKKDKNADASLIARLDAWMTLRQGSMEDARERMAALTQTDPLAELGMAVIAERSGERYDAMVRYLDLAQRYSGELLGAYARTRVGIITGTDVPRSDTTRAMEEAAASVPDWLESLLENPTRITSLEIDPARSDVRTLERTALRAKVTNLAPIPMGVGPDRTISTRLLLLPWMEVQGVQLNSTGEMIEVVSLARRLRLLPREHFESVFWADGGESGMLMDLSSSTATRVRWRALQGFRYTPERMYDRGPHSVSTDTPMFTRRPSARFLLPLDGLRSAIETGGPRELGEAILAVRARQARTIEPFPLTPVELEGIMDLLAVRMSTGDKTLKSLILALLPSPMVQPESVRVDQAAMNESDADVLTLLLALRAHSANSPLLTMDSVRNSERLSQLAEDVRDRLQRGVTTLATSTSDIKPAVKPIVGPPAPPDTGSTGADPAGVR